MQEIQLEKEDKILNENFQINIEELKNMSNFFNSFINNIKNITSFRGNKYKSKKENNPNIYESILSKNLKSFYESFKTCINGIKNITNNIQNDFIKPIDLFIDEQSKIYQNNNKIIKQMIKQYNDYKIMLEFAKNNYFKSSLEVKKNNNNSLLIQSSFKNEGFDNSLALNIKNKMIAKNYESIYKYEINKYNNFVSNINKNYFEVKKRIEDSEKMRIFFIKGNLDKFKLFLDEIKNEFSKFIETFEKNFSNDICNDEQKIWKNKLFESKYAEPIFPLETFIPFQLFYDKNQEIILKDKYNFDIKIENIEYYKKIYHMNEEDLSDNFNDIIINLLEKENINPDKTNLLFDLIQYHKKKESWKIFIDCLLNKNNQSLILKFSNIKNLEILADCLNYIILREDSISGGNFEINIKIIYISEKTFFQNDENNDKIYLSALLSKNKYLRTSQFWRNIIEFKLANKISDSIKRLNDVFNFKNERRKSFLSKISGAIKLYNKINN